MHAFRLPFAIFFLTFALVTNASYVNREKGFAIDFPKKWEIRENFLGAAAIAVSPTTGKHDEFRENVNIVEGTLPKPMPVKAYFDLNIGVMRKIFTDFQVVQTGVNRLGHDETRWIVYTHRMKSLKVKVLLYFVTRGTRGYAVTCSALPTTFGKYFPTFQKVAKTFRLLTPEPPSVTRK